MLHSLTIQFFLLILTLSFWLMFKTCKLLKKKREEITESCPFPSVPMIYFQHFLLTPQKRKRYNKAYDL